MNASKSLKMVRGKNEITLTVFILIIHLSFIRATEPGKIQYTITETDSSYLFKGSFITSAELDCLLNIFFQYEHIKALAPDAEVLLIKKGDGWNRVSYTYKKYLYFENTTEWIRKLDKKHNSVYFKLISSKNNKSIMPDMKSSSGYYQITGKDDRYIVEYYQECIISESKLTSIYLGKMKKEAIQFLKRLSEYSSDHCTSIN